MVYRVAIIDDADDLRTLFRTFLDRSPDFEVCGEGACGEDACELAQTLQPDVMLLDFSMPGSDGYDVLRQVTALSARTRVIMVSGFTRDELADKAHELGAAGFLQKDVWMTDLADRVLAVLEHAVDSSG